MAEYIEREALCKRCGAESDAECHLCVVRYVPAADVAPVVHGEWADDNYDPRFICQECGKWFLVEDATGDMNYCPHCGADMRERRPDEN